MAFTDELDERPYERLRCVLDRAGLSNREVADRIEVAPETVSRWRSGQQEVRARDLRAVITLLGERGIAVTEEWIRTGDPASLQSGREALQQAVAATSGKTRGAQLEPKDVPAADPRKRAAAEEKGRKRAG